MLLSLACVFAAIVATQAPKARALPVALSWWALSFPVAALTITGLRIWHAGWAGVFHTGLGVALLALLVVIVVARALRLGLAIAARKICAPA